MPLIPVDSTKKVVVLVREHPGFSTTDYNLILSREPLLDTILFNNIYSGLTDYFRTRNYTVHFYATPKKLKPDQYSNICIAYDADAVLSVNNVFINVNDLMQTVEDNIEYYCFCPACRKYYASPAKVKYNEKSALDQCPYCRNNTDIVYLYARSLPPFTAEYTSKVVFTATLFAFVARDSSCYNKKIRYEDYVYVKREAVPNSVDIYYRNYALELARVGKDISQFIDKIVSLSYQPAVRSILSTRRFDFQYAVMEIEKGRWNYAADIWKEYLNDSHKKIRGIAYHNMALYYEKNRDIGKAISYSDTATSLVRNRYVKKYNKEIHFINNYYNINKK